MKCCGKHPKLTREDRERAAVLLAEGWPVSRISAEYGVSLSTMRRYLNADRVVKHHVERVDG